MQADKTEMLYWLQEERKQQALEYEMSMRKNHQFEYLKPNTADRLAIPTPVQAR